MTFKSILNAVNLCKTYGIANQLNFIFGGPKETIETMQKTFKIAQTFNPEQISLNVFQPIPAIDATNELKTNGGSFPQKYWTNMHNFYYKSMINSKSLKKEQINKFIKMVDRYFIQRFFFKGLNDEKLRFLKEMFTFFLFLKPKFGFHLHDLYKFTLRRYIYEKNLAYVHNT